MGLLKKITKILSLGKKQDNPVENDLNIPNVNSETTRYGKNLNMSVYDKQKNIALLTPREYQLYLLLLQGFTLKESAHQLSVKYSTANTHINGIYKKLCISSRAELIINYHDIC